MYQSRQQNRPGSSWRAALLRLGVRTMAEGEGSYSPLDYHNGTVWPHDNSLIAAGLARYGYRQEAGPIALAAARGGDLLPLAPAPEVFAGYPRSLTRFPVEYLTASSPQAWSTGTPLLPLRALMGLEPGESELLVDPAVPPEIGRIALGRIPGHWGRTDATGG